METLNILEEVAFDERKPIFRTLLQGSGSRVMLLCLRAGQVVPEHSAPGPMTIQALSGRAVFYDGSTPTDTPIEMKAGTLIRLQSGQHRVEAREDAVLLVTILGLV
ncbi:MAG: cupin domain-containing protein [Acidobacteriota bacterium]|nr:cupin domain-containing protein [Acidobacteriota bacterium]